MDSPEQNRSYTKWDLEDGPDLKSDRVVVDDDNDNDDWDETEKRKHRSSRSRKSGGEELEGRKSNDGGRKKSGSALSDEEDYDSRRETRSKKNKKQEESSLDKLSSWYRDGDLENKQDRGSRKPTQKDSLDHHGRARNKDENTQEGELEKAVDKREKSHGSRRRWDETEVERKGEDGNSERVESRSLGKGSDSKYESPRGKNPSSSRGLDHGSEKGTKASNNSREERSRVDSERSGRRQHDSEYYSDMDYERSYKRKEIEKEDRSRERDESWGDRNSRDRDRDRDRDNNRDRDWEIHRHGRPANRKDGNRSEAVKTSSKFGISNENYDVIEIQTKPLLASSNNDEDVKERYPDEDSDRKGRGGVKSTVSGRSIVGSGSHPPYGTQEPVGSFNRASMQGMKGNRLGRGGGGGRGRSSGRDSQQVPIPIPIMASPFGPIGMAPPLTPTMSPAPGPPISPGVFLPSFSPPVWAGNRGVVDLTMLAGPPSGPRFPPSLLSPVNPAMYFNPSGPVRGSGPPPPNMAGPVFNSPGSMVGRGNPADKPPWGGPPAKSSSGPPGKAPSRGEQNDYSQNFVDTGMRPQNFIRELELTNVVEDYPKLRELIQKKDEIVAKSASTPVYYQCDLKEFELSPDFFGTKFDVILVDPPWEEYVHRAPGVADHMEYWTFEEIMNLKIEAIADTPSFIFLWVGDGVGLEQGRQCLKKWGFRRCEDICWVKTNKNNATPGLRHDSHTLFQHSKEHCLMGIKGTVRRSTDGHIIHANIDTDVIIADEPPYGSTQKPEDMYRIIEHFALGRRRLELFGEDHNIRSGWLTVGKDLSSSNFNSESYIKNFCDKDGKVWQGGGGRNPPPEAPHLVVTTPEIESLRPKSPMKNQQQLQQQVSASISLTTATSSNRRAAAAGNSPQNMNALALSQEASSNLVNAAAPWPPMEIFKGPEDKIFDMYGYGGGRVNGDYMDFETHRQMNLL